MNGNKKMSGNNQKLGILVLGQTPRPDLESLFGTYLPGVEICIRGGLDNMSGDAIDAMSQKGGEYPLLTILADGSTREISMNLLVPHLSRCAGELADNGAALALLICAGAFPDIASPIPILYPGRIVPAVVAQLSATRRIGIITPNPGQVASARNHWQNHGFNVEVSVASPKEDGALERAARELNQPDLELIVLDCMGFNPQAGRHMQKLTGRPVICPQSLIARVMGEYFGIDEL